MPAVQMSMPQVEGAGSLAPGHPASRNINMGMSGSQVKFFFYRKLSANTVTAVAFRDWDPCLTIRQQCWGDRRHFPSFPRTAQTQLPASRPMPKCSCFHSSATGSVFKSKSCLTSVSISIATVGQDIWNEDYPRKAKMEVCHTDVP